MGIAVAGVVLWFSLAQIAPAAPAAPAPPPTASAPSTHAAEVVAPRPVPRVSLSFSPLQLLWPVSDMGINKPFVLYELAGELRVHEKVSFMVFGGLGNESAPGAPGVRKVTDTEWHYGLQARYYFAGNFRRGWPIGVEAYWFRFESEDVYEASGSTDRGGSRGRAAGPFLGYKHTFDSGFTIDGELGWVYITMTEQDYRGHAGFQPIINLKVGWSF
jgi:hypothetical protein